MPHSCSHEGAWSSYSACIRGFLSRLCGVIGKSGGVTLPLAFNASFFPPWSLKMEYSETREVFLSSGAAWHKKPVYAELHISGSGSAYVGDRGIWGFNPLYLPLHKSCFVAYTLANMICVVTSLPAR